MLMIAKKLQMISGGNVSGGNNCEKLSCLTPPQGPYNQTVRDNCKKDLNSGRWVFNNNYKSRAYKTEDGKYNIQIRRGYVPPLSDWLDWGTVSTADRACDAVNK